MYVPLDLVALFERAVSQATASALGASTGQREMQRAVEEFIERLLFVFQEELGRKQMGAG